MMNAPQILIAEDESKVARLLEDYLSAAQMVVRKVTRGDAVIPALLAQPADVLLLDLRLPGADGHSVLRQLTAHHVVPAPGVIVISALVEEIDRLLGLELGADDYICKPFSPREVVARVKALLRRRQSGNVATLTQLPVPELESKVPLVLLQEDRLQCQINGVVVNLTAVEFRLLQTLYAAPGRIFGREQLMQHLYADHRVVAERTVDSHVKKLRQKLDAAAAEWELIVSVYGAGFRYEPTLR